MQQFCVIENDRPATGYQSYLSVSGQFNFFVAVEVKRRPGTSNSNISITAFSRADRAIAIAVKCRWEQIDGEYKYDLNMTANFYQLSPRDIGRSIEITVSPFEDGFTGQCVVLYGPIALDKTVEDKLARALAANYLELPCEGNTRRTTSPFDLVQVDNEEIQCTDNSRSRNNMVDRLRISKDMLVDPSQVNSLQMRVVAPGNEFTAKLKSHEDRDLLILFVQSTINKKDPAKRNAEGSAIFGQPIRVPNQLDESQLYDLKTIQFQQRYGNSDSLDHNNSFKLGPKPPAPNPLREPVNIFAQNKEDLPAPQQREDLGLLRREVERLQRENQYLVQGQAQTQSLGSNYQLQLDELRAENQKLRLNNQALLNENELLSKQKNEIMDDQSFFNDQNDRVYKTQIDHLSLKLKEHRTRAKEFEGLLLDAEKNRIEMSKQLEAKSISELRAQAELRDLKARLEAGTNQSNYYMNKLKELEKAHGQVLLDLSENRNTAAKVPRLEENNKGLNLLIQQLNKEKAQLCELVSSLRDQLNEIEEEKTNAKNDESLMKQKLEFVVKEKEVLVQKIRNLEGMYKSEIGEVQNVEQLMQQIKKSEMEAEFARKSEAKAKKESAELKFILQGLKDQITQIEGQRDHFEDKCLNFEQLVRQSEESHETADELQRRSISTQEQLMAEINRLRLRLDSSMREKQMLEEENREMQDRIDQNLNQMIGIQSSRRNHADEHWKDLGELLRKSGLIEVPADYEPTALVDCVLQLLESIEEDRDKLSELENQVLELRQAKIELLQKLEADTSSYSINGHPVLSSQHLEEEIIRHNLESKLKSLEGDKQSQQTLIEQLNRNLQQLDAQNKQLLAQLDSAKKQELTRQPTERQVAAQYESQLALETIKKNLENARIDNENLRKENQTLKASLAAATKETEAKKAEISTFQQDNSKLVQEILNLQAQAEQNKRDRTRLEEAEKERSDLRLKSDSVVKQLIAQLNANNATGVETEKLKLENNMMKSNLEVLRKEAHNREAMLQACTRDLEQARQSAKAHERTIAMARDRIESLERDLASAKQVSQNLSAEIAKLSEELREQQTKLHLGNSLIQSNSAQIAGLSSENDRLKQEVSALNERIEKEIRELQSKDATQTEINARLESLRAKLRQAEEASGSQLAQIDGLKAQLALVEQERDGLRAEAAKLTASDHASRQALAAAELQAQQLAQQSSQLGAQVAELKGQAGLKDAKHAELEREVEESRSAQEQATHEKEMRDMEFSALASELERVKGVLDKFSEKEQSVGKESRLNSVSLKMLEDQVGLLSAENSRLREEKQALVISSERLKVNEVQVKQSREEAALLKAKNEYLALELERRNADLDALAKNNGQMLDKLREEIRTLKEKDLRSSVGGAPQTPDKNSAREIGLLQGSLAKAEQEIRRRDQTIRELEGKAKSESQAPPKSDERLQALQQQLFDKEQLISELRYRLETAESRPFARPRDLKDTSGLGLDRIMLDMSLDERQRSPRPRQQPAGEEGPLAERYRQELQEREEQLNLMIKQIAEADRRINELENELDEKELELEEVKAEKQVLLSELLDKDNPANN